MTLDSVGEVAIGRWWTTVFIGILSAALAACGNSDNEPGDDSQGFSAPSSHTSSSNQKLAKSLPRDDGSDLEAAMRGFIATREDSQAQISNHRGEVVWNLDEYQFLEEEAPYSTNPSLWRQASLNNIHGLFKVTDRVYQVRGFDLANMTIIQGHSGWIIVDPLTAEETAAAALALARQHLGNAPVVAVIFTHSHIDHFAGVWGVISKEDYKAGKVRVIAPEGFMEEATSENVIAGIAMARRASFMYGRRLPRNPRGHIDSGLGKTPAYGAFGIATPTEIIDSTGQRLDIDGLEFVFQNAPGSEAPAELTFAIPELAAYCGAEVATRTLHNLYTLRGAKVRDALKWSAYIDEMIALSVGSDVYFASHHWPVWGRENIVSYLELHRDTYKFIHDQTVRLFNKGFTSREIAEQLQLPPSLAQAYSNRGYYGTVKHNSKAVYQAYLGWYDANPANLDPLPPVEAAARYVDLAGGVAALLEKARTAFDAGDYRWTAELLSHLVFDQPDNRVARTLLAETYDQMGYQAESAPWRDVYLSAAYELRHGAPQESLVELSSMLGILQQTPVEKFFQAMSVRLDAEKARDVERRVAIVFTDLNESYLLTVENSVMHFQRDGDLESADGTLRLTRELFTRMLVGDVGLRETLTSDALELDGSVVQLLRFFSLFETPDAGFNIVTP
jgi:alkyl sulfatase BDS1-like metallo-beta-lactamase superfamily hydrolase